MSSIFKRIENNIIAKIVDVPKESCSYINIIKTNYFFILKIESSICLSFAQVNGEKENEIESFVFIFFVFVVL